MAETFHFDLVSPESLLLSADVEQVVVPGSEGQFTVLPRHAPFMSTLKPGAVEITSGGQTQSFFVSGGFADVNPGGLTILADEAMPIDTVDAARIDALIAETEKSLADMEPEHRKRVGAEKRLGDLRDYRRWIIPA
jgi:F-type H+-transporting ATPase subunit epsilon